MNCSKTPGFEVIHGLLDRLMMVLNQKPTIDKAKNPNEGYHISKGQGKLKLWSVDDGIKFRAAYLQWSRWHNTSGRLYIPIDYKMQRATLG